MSKWIKKDKFKEFANKKAVEVPEEKQSGDFIKKWRNPVMGTQDKAKEYIVRFLPDPESNFYIKYMFHYFVIDEKHYFIHCPKTDNMQNYCPWCAVNQMLYKGNKDDKKLAYKYKRREKFVGNIFIVSDPRDDDVDDEYKVSGKTRLYEFPATIESKLKNEINDKEEGYGEAIFDPEDGYNLIIRIKAKKPDGNGKIWPDYSDTIFSRKSSAIADTEKEIEEIMSKTVNLDEYLDSQKLTWEEHSKLLKIEGFWEDVEEEFKRRTGINKSTQDSNKVVDITSDKDVKEELSELSDIDSDSDDQSDEDLLNELKNM